MASSLRASAHQSSARDHLLATCILAPTLVIFNSGVAIYLCRDDLLSVASITVSSLVLLLLFALHLGCGEPGHGGGGGSGKRRKGQLLIKSGIWCLTLLLAVLLACKLVQIGPLPTPLLLGAVAGVAALGVGGGCAFLLHRRSWSKQPCQEVILPLVRDMPL